MSHISSTVALARIMLSPKLRTFVENTDPMTFQLADRSLRANSEGYDRKVALLPSCEIAQTVGRLCDLCVERAEEVTDKKTVNLVTPLERRALLALIGGNEDDYNRCFNAAMMDIRINLTRRLRENGLLEHSIEGEPLRVTDLGRIVVR